MEERKPLSRFGVGPYYAALVFALTMGALLLNRRGLVPVCPGGGRWGKVLGAVCIAAGAALWLNAVFVKQVGRCIRENRLVTTGAYAWVRNPIYAAIMMVMWGLLLWSGNPALLVLCPVYHLLMTVMVKRTEERWLAERYGEAYRDYCRRVNRCLPWFPRRG